MSLFKQKGRYANIFAVCFPKLCLGYLFIHILLLRMIMQFVFGQSQSITFCMPNYLAQRLSLQKSDCVSPCISSSIGFEHLLTLGLRHLTAFQGTQRPFSLVYCNISINVSIIEGIFLYLLQGPPFMDFKLWVFEHMLTFGVTAF